MTTKNMNALQMPTKDLIFLTGAGFTKNFGGFTGQEMWNKVLNHPDIQRLPKLRALLLNEPNFDFETAYTKVFVEPEFDNADRIAFTEALRQAYENIDRALRGWLTPNLNQGGISRNNIFGQFIGLFCGNGRKRGMVFTLNQDLFLERGSGLLPFAAPKFSLNLQQNPNVSVKNERLMLPNEMAVENFGRRNLVVNGNSPFYIKLHGSYGWYSSDGLNQNRMVIGLNKKQQIDEEPLLKFYFELLEGTIAQGNKDLLICGYGFKDTHINQVLLKGTTEHGLKISILSPSDPKRLHQTINGTGLWPHLRRIFPYSLRDIFPNPHSSAPAWEEIRRAFVGF